MRGAVNEGASGGQNSGDTGGSHQPLVTNAPFTAMAADVTVPPMGMGSASGLSPVAPNPSPDSKRTYSPAEKLACSIEAMRNGGECEACQ